MPVVCIYIKKRGWILLTSNKKRTSYSIATHVAHFTVDYFIYSVSIFQKMTKNVFLHGFYTSLQHFFTKNKKFIKMCLLTAFQYRDKKSMIRYQNFIFFAILSLYTLSTKKSAVFDFYPKKWKFLIFFALLQNLHSYRVLICTIHYCRIFVWGLV